MKRTVKTIILATCLVSAMLVVSQAADMEHHHPGEEAAMPAGEMPEMMKQKMEMMQDQGMMASKPCMLDGAPCSKPCMMDKAKPGRHHGKGAGMAGMMAMDHGMRGMNPARMQQRMDHELFLDRVDALGLSQDQVTKLKAIRAECRKQNIRKAADAQISRLELKELLNEENWSLKTAEPLIRQIQTLEGDMLVRHLQAVAEARAVLTAEQLQKAAANEDSEDLEELFK